MKVPIYTHACGTLFLAIALALAGCGGRQTMASKSSAAYDDAIKKGIPIQAGEHGGHENADRSSTAEQAAMPGMDHAGMAGMDHSKMSGMQHDATAGGMKAMPGMDHAGTAGMDHSTMSGMQHGATSSGMKAMPGMDHAATSGKAQDSMVGMPGMQHGSSSVAPIVIAAPASNSEIAKTQPAMTLRADEFDAPAAAPIGDAGKADAGRDMTGMAHSVEQAPTPTTPQKDHKATVHHPHGSGDAR